MGKVPTNEKQNAIWIFLNSHLGLLLLGFLLTTLAGGIISYWFNIKAWERQITFETQRNNYEWERSRRFETLRRKLDDGEKTLDEISDLINLRSFRLNQVFDNIKLKDFASAEKNWKKYYETVETWNHKLITYQYRLSRLVGPAIAGEFNNFETDRTNLIEPKSIHGKFFMAHNKVLSLLRCGRKTTCFSAAEMLSETNERLRDLDFQSDSFVDKVSTIFLEQAFQLEKSNN